MKASLTGILLLLAVGPSNAGSIVSSGPNGEEAVKLRGEYLAQALPISYEPHVKQADQFHISWIELTGRTQAFAERHSATDLIYALWPWFDDPQHAPEATILLLGVTHREMMRPQRLTYVDRANPGNWVRLASGYMDECKIACRGALGQPEWWYPHKVIFDRETVLKESKTNALVRSKYIAQMVQVLSNPQIRTDNPLEVKSILGLLCEIRAVNAASTFCDYLFYDWRTGRDYRFADEVSIGQGAYPNSALAAVACLASLGETTIPVVLDRFSRVTAEESSVNVGGGGAPVLAVRYFYLLHYTEQQAISAIEDFKLANRDLPEVRIARMNELVEAIRGKKYRPRFFRANRSDWAAPEATNSFPGRTP